MERIRKKQAETKARNELREQNKLVELAERAKQGDPLARMKTAEPNSLEYWQAYKDYEIEQSQQFKEERIRLVNGISVLEDDFAERVIATIAEEKKIFSTIVTGRKNKWNDLERAIGGKFL